MGVPDYNAVLYLSARMHAYTPRVSAMTTLPTQHTTQHNT
jgi:hypothetical protein